MVCILPLLFAQQEYMRKKYIADDKSAIGINNYNKWRKCSMKKVLTEKQAIIHGFLMDTEGEKFTAYQIADATGIERKSINVLVNGLVSKGYCVREETTGTDDEGKTVTVKYVVLTDEGRGYDADAAAEHDAAEAEAKKEADKAKRAAKKAEKEAAAE